MATKPSWKHDCDKCKFLGQTIGGGQLCDLYFCDGIGGGTLLARYGDDGPEYYSTIAGYARPKGHAELWAAQTLWRSNA